MNTYKHKTANEIIEDITNLINKVIEIKKINDEPDCIIVRPGTCVYEYMVKELEIIE
jgi:hypothetical protein